MNGICRYAVCSNCGAHFNVRDLRNAHAQRFPLVLKCGHAACEPCIRGNFSEQRVKEFECGLCKTATPFSGSPRELRSTFPVHFYLLGQFLMRAREKSLQEPEAVFQPKRILPKQPPKKVPCAECDKKDAVWYCKECKTCMCDSCFANLHRKSLKFHVRQHVDHMDDFEKTNICPDHPKSDIDMFCITCDSPYCVKCLILYHKDHEYISCSVKNEELLQSVEASLVLARQRRMRLKQSLQEVQELTGGASGAKQAALEDVERSLAQHTISAHGRLQLLESALVDQIGWKRSANEESLGKVQTAVVSSLGELEAAMRSAKAAVRPETLAASNLIAVKKKLEEAVSYPCFLVCKEVSGEITVDQSIFDGLPGMLRLSLSEGEQFVLASEEELPESYVPSPLPDTIDDDIIDSLSEVAVCDTITSNVSQPQSTSTSRSSSPVLIPAGRSTQPPSKDFHMMDPLESLSVGTKSKVLVVRAVNPSEFYVQLMMAQKPLKVLSDLLQKASKNADYASNFDNGEMYLVFSKSMKKWLRACIVSQVQTGIYEAWFVDYGHLENVAENMIKILPKRFSKCPTQAVSCALYSLKPISDEWKNVKVFVDLTVGNQFEMHVLEMSSEGQHIVDLIELCGPQSSYSIRDALLFEGSGALSNSGLQSSALPKKSLDTINLDAGSVHIVHLAWGQAKAPHHFFIQLDENEQLINLITASCMKNNVKPVLHPVVGLLCLAPYIDQNWYRARVLEVSADKVKVFFVDYGNEFKVPYYDLRRFPDELYQFPAQAICCCFSDVALISKESVEFLMEVASEQCLSARIDAHDGGLHKIQLFSESEESISYLLVNKGLARCYQDEDGDEAFTKLGSTECLSVKGEMQAENLQDSQPSELKDKLANPNMNDSGIHECIMASSVELVPIESLSLTQDSNINFGETATNENNEESSDLNSQSLTPNSINKPNDDKNYICDEIRFATGACQSPAALRPSVSETIRSSSVQCRLKQAQRLPVVVPECPKRIPVEVIHIESPGCIFFRLKAQKEKNQRLRNDMIQFYESEKKYVDESANWIPLVKDRCAVKIQQDCGWHRALVLEVLPSSMFKVMLKDLGKTEVVHRSAVRKLAHCFSQVPDGAVKCHLANVKAAGSKENGKQVWSSVAIEKLSDMINSHRANLFISKNGQISKEQRSLPVDLWIQSSKASALGASTDHWFTINRHLVDLGLALPIDWSAMTSEDELTSDDFNILNPADDPDSTYLELLERTNQDSTNTTDTDESDEEFEVSNTGKWTPPQPFPLKSFCGFITYVDDDCNFFMHDLEQAGPLLRKVNKRLKKRFMYSKPESTDHYWFPKQICAVQYHLDGQYYRGEIKKVNDNNTLDVLLVDYGNVEECQSIELRKNVICDATPILARKCRVPGLKPVSDDGQWNKTVLGLIHQAVVEKECIVTVLRLPTPEDDVHLVDFSLRQGENVKTLLAELELATFDDSPVCLMDIPTPARDKDREPGEDPDVLVLAEEDDTIHQPISEPVSKPNVTRTLSSIRQKLKDSLKNEKGSCLKSSCIPSSLGQDAAVSETPAKLVSNEPNSEVHCNTNSEGALGCSSTDGPVSSITSISSLFSETQSFPPPVISQDNVWIVRVSKILSITEVVINILSVPNDPVMTEIIESFGKMSSDMQLTAPSLAPLKNFYTGLPCVFLSNDELWKRGSIHVVKKDKVIIHQVDFGIIETVNLTKVKSILPHWLKQPVMGYECQLNLSCSEQESNPKVSDLLKSCLLDKKLEAHVLSRNPTRIELFEYESASSESKKLAYQPLLSESFLLRK